MANKLTGRQKVFLVHRLAEFDSPKQAADALLEWCGVELSPQGAEHYHPYKAVGADLSKPLRKEFDEHRQKFLKDTSAIPIANKAVRLKRTEHVCMKALANGEMELALGAMAQAAKEEGGSFTNQRQLVGKDGGAVQLEVGNLSRDELLGELRTLLTPPGGTAPAIVDRAAAPPKAE